MGKQEYKPGQAAPASGQYGVVGPRGGTSHQPEVTVPQGTKFPPTPKPGEGYVMNDPTHNKSGHGK